MTARWRRLDSAILLALAVIATWTWYAGAIAPVRTDRDPLLTIDLFAQIYPASYLAADMIRAGELPLWNPYQSAGHPFLATGIYGILYPLNVLYLLLPTAAAIEVLAVLHIALAGIFTYLLGRRISGRREVALVMALVFMLSGFVIGQAFWFSPSIAAVPWLPLALLGLEWIFAGWLGRGAALTGAALALAFLAGWPQTLLYSAYVVAAYALLRGGVIAVSRSFRELLPLAAAGAAAATIAFLLMAPQLLPQLELSALGPRGTGPLSVAQSILFAWPNPRQALADALDATPGWPRAFYLGVASLTLIPLSLLAAGQSWRLVCFWALGISAFCVAVNLAPALHVYRSLGGAHFRIPMRIVYIYGFAGAVLAGFGYGVLARAVMHRERRGWIFAVATLAALLAGAVAPPLTRVYLGVALALTLLASLLPWQVLRRSALLGLGVLLLLDLARASYAGNEPRPIHGLARFDRNRAVFERIRSEQGYGRTYIAAHVDLPEVMSKQGSLRKLYSMTDYEPLSLNRVARLLRAIEVPDWGRADHLTFTGALRTNPTWPGFRLLDLYGLRWVVLPRGDVVTQAVFAAMKSQWRLVLAPSDGGVLLYERVDPLPRAFVATHVEVAQSEDDALAKVTRETFDPRSTTVIEPAGNRLEKVPKDPMPRIRPAQISAYEPRRVVVRTTSSTPGFLVLSDTFYPGWTATVDGEPAPILCANFMFRAVAVGAGDHEVVFRYEPASFRTGAVLGVLGLVAIAGALMFDCFRRSTACR